MKGSAWCTTNVGSWLDPDHPPAWAAGRQWVPKRKFEPISTALPQQADLSWAGSVRGLLTQAVWKRGVWGIVLRVIGGSHASLYRRDRTQPGYAVS